MHEASCGQRTGISLWTTEQSPVVPSILAELVLSTAVVTWLLYTTENTHSEHWPHSQARKTQQGMVFCSLLKSTFGITAPLWKPLSEEGVQGLRDLGHGHGGRCKHVPGTKRVGAPQLGKQRDAHLNLLWSLLTPPILKGQQGWKEDKHLQEEAQGQKLRGSSWVPTGVVLTIFLFQYQWHFPAGQLKRLIFLDAFSSCSTLPTLCTGHTGGCLPGDCSL